MIPALLHRLDLSRSMQLYQLMRMGTAVLTGILLAKTGLTTEELGRWEALLFIGTLVLFTGVNGLLQAISPNYLPLSEREKPLFFQEVLGVFLLLGGLLLISFVLLESTLVPFLTGFSNLPGFKWYALFLFLQLPSLPTEIYFLLKERPKAIFWWGFWGFGAQLVAVVFPAWQGWGLEGMLQLLCWQAALKVLITLWILGPFSEGPYRFQRIRRYLKLAWPLVATSFTGNLIVFFDTWLVAHWFSDGSTFAIYRYGSREFPLALALATALGTAMVPRLTANLEEGLQELKLRSSRLLHTVLPLTALLLISVHEWFPVVFHPNLAPAASLFSIYLLLSLSRVLLPNSVLIGLSDTRIIWKVSLIELVLKVVTGLLFLRLWGLEGLAWSAILSFWFEKIALGTWLWKQHSITPDRWLDWRTYGFYSILLLLLFVMVHGK